MKKGPYKMKGMSFKESPVKFFGAVAARMKLNQNAPQNSFGSGGGLQIIGGGGRKRNNANPGSISSIMNMDRSRVEQLTANKPLFGKGGLNPFVNASNPTAGAIQNITADKVKQKVQGFIPGAAAANQMSAMGNQVAPQPIPQAQLAQSTTSPQVIPSGLGGVANLAQSFSGGRRRRRRS